MTRKFPKAEAEVLELGKKLADGLAANPDLFPAPPASSEAINELLARLCLRPTRHVKRG
uniref:Uncharacterized protein n=1 Tax=Candidatus Kentrum sp. FW TaxID=2126338 RepID=A0A450TCE5_9GAMM|nr:MAG: hypothetical protein BECKFW1821A_GA0114235_11742 [Candidatus Kentron sp. FW]